MEKPDDFSDDDQDGQDVGDPVESVVKSFIRSVYIKNSSLFIFFVVACNMLPPLIQLSLHLNFRIQFSKTKAKVQLLIVEYLELTKLKFKIKKK